MRTTFTALATVLALTACGQTSNTSPTIEAETPPVEVAAEPTAEEIAGVIR